MWKRFTEPARRVIFYAQEEAQRLQQGEVSPDHLLLSLLREPSCVAVQLLTGFGITIEAIKEPLNRLVTLGSVTAQDDMPLSLDAKKTIELAYHEAQILGNNYVGTEHLLLGLLGQENGLTARVLNPLGVGLERTRQEISRLQKEKEDS